MKRNNSLNYSSFPNQNNLPQPPPIPSLMSLNTSNRNPYPFFNAPSPFPIHPTVQQWRPPLPPGKFLSGTSFHGNFILSILIHSTTFTHYVGPPPDSLLNRQPPPPDAEPSQKKQKSSQSFENAEFSMPQQQHQQHQQQQKQQQNKKNSQGKNPNQNPNQNRNNNNNNNK